MYGGGAAGGSCTMPEMPVNTVSSLAEIASLSREELVLRLMTFDGRFHFDFTEAFLAQKSTDQLRHILIAACKHAAKDGPEHPTSHL